MNRINFNNNDDEYNEWSEEPQFYPYDENSGEDAPEPATTHDMMRFMDMDISERHLEMDVLSHATNIASQSFWWRFLSLANKLQKISTTYSALTAMLDKDND